MLKVVINTSAEELLKVYGGETLDSGYDLDIDSHPNVQLFVQFCRQLLESLLRAMERKFNQGPVPTSDRPSSGDTTLENVSDNIANHFLTATFEYSRVRKHYWSATQNTAPLNLACEGYSLIAIL
jgi:hypothetical protein